MIESSLVGKPFDSANPFKAKSRGTMDKSQRDEYSRNSYDSYAKLEYLLGQLEGKDKAMKLLKETNEYSHMVSIKAKTDTVIAEIRNLVEKLTAEPSEMFERGMEGEDLEKRSKIVS